MKLKISNKYIKQKNILSLVIAVAICELAGLVGSIFTFVSVNSWYAILIKPVLTPPAWVFGPVWITLFLLMGVAVYLVWVKPESHWHIWGGSKKLKQTALIIFAAQLVLNILWSFVFFGLHNPLAGLIEIIVLWLAIAATIWVFAKISRSAAWLLLPYLLWVSFAMYLTTAIWLLNRNVPLSQGVLCTMEAKQCPDGSYVGRIPPKCEFAPCPGVWPPSTDNVPSDWLTLVDDKQAVSFKYPSQLSTTYIHAEVNWPPKITVTEGVFDCPTTPPTSSFSNRQNIRLVDNRQYCVAADSAGAAGSTFTDYIYTTERQGKLISLSFTVRYVQCLNYDESKQNECTKERETFDLDSVVDRMMSTVVFGK